MRRPPVATCENDDRGDQPQGAADGQHRARIGEPRRDLGHVIGHRPRVAAPTRAPQAACHVSFTTVTTPSDVRALAGELSLAVVRLTRHLRGRRVDSQISLTQLSALATLAREGAMTPGALAAKERVQPPSMTRVIASLTDLGLVQRDPHPTDGRQIIVSLSSAGRALIDDETSAREAWMTEQLAGLTDDQLLVLTRAVGIMKQIVTESE
ncbi:MarR family transcriptional regulator [Nocardia arthritidis]|uniref:MarR family transcriptional regulator n=1 Tax=Nocardia arthritidis TaxID=228602 RepID=A0A6G9Y6A3_9NOCA|nr:MarR family transcriptional regulator [Nocardia arthritidis]